MSGKVKNSRILLEYWIVFFATFFYTKYKLSRAHLCQPAEIGNDSFINQNLLPRKILKIQSKKFQKRFFFFFCIFYTKYKLSHAHLCQPADIGNDSFINQPSDAHNIADDCKKRDIGRAPKNLRKSGFFFLDRMETNFIARFIWWTNALRQRSRLENRYTH